MWNQMGKKYSKEQCRMNFVIYTNFKKEKKEEKRD